MVKKTSQTITKAELVAEMAKRTNTTKKQANDFVESFQNLVREELVKGNKIQLMGFGSFEARSRAARKGRNPQTGAEITIPATVVPAFKAGKALKQALN